MRLGPYEILAPLGAGGMGEVYRARDTRLGRDVAVKVLPAGVADPERLKRFEREARATAALSHPNITVVFDVGTHDGVPYLVEELLEGESLRERLMRGAIPLPEAVGIATQIARGLAAAHEKHIVHRDLKPGNVFLTREGTVKILDFGLAKLVESVPAEEADTLSHVPTGTTGFGRVLGTTAYMAPEQARGMPVDPRTDIFAFGVVFYEMLAGMRPFRGETATDTVAAILTQEPPPLPAGVPPGVQRVVTLCLAKLPDQRFSSAHDLALALQAASSQETVPHQTAPGAGIKELARRLRVAGLVLSSVAAVAVGTVLVLRFTSASPSARLTGPPKIVVLPFENLGSPEDAYFAAGMTEEITSRLANVRNLAVISRTTATQYDRKGKTVEQIGKDLGVSFVLEGSVRYERTGAGPGRVRITPQLIRVADDTHVWADRYDRVIADVFAMQSEVAENAVKAMGIALIPSEKTALKEVSTNDMEAYDLYLRGQALGSRSVNKTDLEGALKMYGAAVDRDPHFAKAFAGLSRMHLFMYSYYFDHSADRLAKSKDAAERAVELRTDLAESHAALGWYVYLGMLDYPRALSELSAALKIKPTSTDALWGTAAVLRRQGRWREAAEAFGRALELDPKNANLLFNTGVAYVYARRYTEADRAFGLTIALSPNWADPYAVKAWFQMRAFGDLEKAQAVLDQAGQIAGLTDDEQDLAWTTLELTLARRDYPRALRQLETEASQEIDNQGSFSPIPLLRGQVQSLMGLDDLSRRSFEAARLELEQKIKHDPDDPRFHSALGIVYAGLGRRAEAVREAKLGSSMMPASKDALAAIDRLEDLAAVYTMVGQSSEAIALLDDLLKWNGWFTPHVLRLQPKWDPLRSDPRFQALLKKYEAQP
jgi:TolB-like protein/Tfp pilus assembly protein PilF